MSTITQRESTEYHYMGATGTPPAVGAEVAFMPDPAQRPISTDWHEAIVVDSAVHPLWADAVASNVGGDYFVARLIGPYSDNDLVLPPGDYQPWIRLTDTVEQAVRIAPVTLEIA